MQGFGPVLRETDEPVFHSAWEGRVRGIFGNTVRRFYNLDEFRHAIERMPADRYLQASYYEKWLTGVETLLLEKGVVSRQELAAGRALAAAPKAAAGASRAPALEPRFQLGDRVRARNLNPPGHTRLPRYARGKRGTVRLVHGPFLVADTNAHLAGEDWEPVYSVAFSARELWGAEAPAADTVCIDLWERYLEGSE
jgi:nitrile hydratase